MTKKPTLSADDDEAHRLFRPSKSLRDDVDALQQCERRRDISHGPLHELALLQALEEFSHRAAPFPRAGGDFNNAWKRGSSRIGSHAGSS